MSRSEFFTTPKTVIATDYGARIPFHGTIDLDAIAPLKDGCYRIPAGLAWYRQPKGEKTYIYPAKNATLVSPTAAAATGLVVTEGFATVFAAGDVLESTADHAAITLSGTYDGTEVVTVTIDGVAYDYDISTLSEYSLPTVAAFIATGLNGKMAVDAISNAVDTVDVFADKGSALSFVVAVAGGTGAATASAAAMATIAVGTIASVDVDTSTLTLAAGAPADLPAGLDLGVPNQNTLEGFTVTEFDPDLNRHNVGLWTSGTLSKGDFYFGREYHAMFPEIKLL